MNRGAGAAGSRGPALVVFAKEPVPGGVKTRLCPPFTPEQAAAFYAEMLADVLDTSLRMAREHGVTPFLALHPPGCIGRVPHPAGFRVEAQQGPGLAERMTASCEARFDEGFAPVLLRGSDSPTLSSETLGAALSALVDHDVVLCPDRDGGYNLVGLREKVPEIFLHPMSTESVLDDTLASARRAGARTAVLPNGFDIDTVADLGLLERARQEGMARGCPRTLAWLDEHRFWRTISS